MKPQKYLSLIFMSILLISSISALTTYAEFEDGTKTKNIEDGSNVSFEVDFFSMNPPMSLSIELRDSCNKLIYTFLNTSASSKTYVGIYSLNKSVYNKLGSYYIIAKGKDSAGSSQYDQLNFNVIDTTSPTGTISYPLDSATYSSNISKFEFTATDLNLAKCEYSTDNGITKNLVSCKSGVLTTVALNSVEGMNKWSIYLTDASGNTASYSVNFIVKSSTPTDTVPPLIDILSPKNGTTYSSNVSFLNFIATDENLKECKYSTDNGITKNLVSCKSGVLTTIALNSVEGMNKWIVYVEDKAGNKNSKEVIFIVNSSFIDNIPPTISIISPEQNKKYHNKTIGLKITTDEEAEATFSLDGKNNITMNNPYDYVFTYTLSLSNNKHGIIFYAKDKAGNIASKKVEFFIDYKKDNDNDEEEKEEENVREVNRLNPREDITLGEIKNYYEEDNNESKIIYLSSKKAKPSCFENIVNFFKSIWESIVNFFKKLFGLK